LCFASNHLTVISSSQLHNCTEESSIAFRSTWFFSTVSYIVRAKILLQKVWASGADWGEPFNSDLQSEACQWFSELMDCEQIRVPRCLCHRDCSELTSTELHVFSDASADAYGAVAYARCTYDSETLSSVGRQKSHLWNRSVFLVWN